MNKLNLEGLNRFIKDNEDFIDTNQISDGDHTFDELYHHRAILFAMVVYYNSDKSWKSKQHFDGTMFGDDKDEEPMFIVGITTPEGDYSYHYHMEYWDMFKCKELERAPEYDGHKPSDITRLFSLL